MSDNNYELGQNRKLSAILFFIILKKEHFIKKYQKQARKNIYLIVKGTIKPGLEEPVWARKKNR